MLADQSLYKGIAKALWNAAQNVLDVKHVATAHKSKDKPQHALLIRGKLVREDKGLGNKRHLAEFLYVF